MGFDLSLLDQESDPAQMAWDFGALAAEPATPAPVIPFPAQPATLEAVAPPPLVEGAPGTVSDAAPTASDAPAAAASAAAEPQEPDSSNLVVLGVRRPRPAAVLPVDDGRQNYVITDTDCIGQGSLLEKFHHNLRAIETLRALEETGRSPEREEQAALVRYVGWGGLSQAFAPLEDMAFSVRKHWEAPHRRLSELLTEEEYRSARASTNTAFYTPQGVIRGLYEGIAHLGFQGGRVLEPALGIGHFFGLMPQGMAQECQLTGVEIDSISGRIAKQLYPKADIRIQGYETAVLRDDSCDLAIGNVPFGDFQLYDPRYKRFNFLIHDYFFAASVDRVRPGGLIVFITSKGTMDKTVLKLRRYLMERCDLVGAIRLPENTFMANAGTEVVSDIVILRKRMKGEAPNGIHWLDTKEVDGENNERISVNEYFASHPEMVLGRLKLKKGKFGVESTVEPDGRDLQKAIAEAFRRLPANTYQPAAPEKLTTAGGRPLIPAPGDAREGSFVLSGGQVYRTLGGQLLPIAASPKTADRIRGMLQLRDLAREVLRLQLGGCDDTTLGQAQWRLSHSYDWFVNRHGYLNSRGNRSAFSGDPDEAFVMALENWDDQEKKATKADIFSRRTLGKLRNIERVESPKEALLVSLNELGRIDWNRMAELTGRPAEDLQDELRGEMVFLNPVDSWETREEYLSGNVRAKLRAAQMAAEMDAQYAENVEALKAVQPVDLTPGDISVRLGSPWIPSEDYHGFLAHILEWTNSRPPASIVWKKAMAKWEVKILTSSVRQLIQNTSTWGTKRVTAVELLEMGLNQQVPTIRDEVEDENGSTRYVINQPATLAAREKLEKMQEAFKTWLWSDQQRAERLVRRYNDLYNSTRARVYDGSHLTLPGIATSVNGRPLSLRKHQLDGIWRMVCGVNTLLAHVVGAGKTFTIVGGIMERRRLGFTSKALVVVPNHLVEQWAREFLQLYPGARILAATKDDFEASRRKELFNRISTGDWDAVIVAHSSFQKIPLSPAMVEAFFQEEIDELTEAIAEADDRTTIKQLERTRKQLKAKMEKMLDAGSKDDVMTWEEMGIDLLATDEAHEFKNLHYTSRMPRMAGLPNTAANKAFDMFLKTQVVNRRKGLVCYATGTPISNTVAEMYTMQRYLQMERLQELDIDHFDRWAANFGKAVTALEVSPDGGGFRMNTRFAQFVNVPELLMIFKEVCDIRTADMLDLPVPKVMGGKAMVIAAEPSEALKQFVQFLVRRAEAIRNGRVKPDEDNMLNITTEGRKAALDMRLLFGSAQDYPGSKVNLMVEQAFAIWQETAELRGAQLIFSDLGTPHDDGRFTVYEDIKQKLVARGVPEAQVAFIHDANTDARKDALFRDVRAGKVRFLLGSTAKMGAGTNVQERLVALHHVDAPWRPSDVEQREGRIIRQGNRLYDEGLIEGVRIYRYVTKGSFDAYMWQCLETKLKFITQVMKGDASIRQVEDVDSAALSYAEVKALASGNPLVMRKVEVDTEVRKYSVLKQQWRDDRSRLTWDASSIPNSLAKLKQELEATQKDIAARQDTKGDLFSIVLQGKRYVDRKDAGMMLLMLLESLRTSDSITWVGEFAGFRLALAKTLGDARLILAGEGEYVQLTGAKTPEGIIATLEGMPLALERVAGFKEKEMADKERRLTEITAKLSEPFEHEEKLAALLLEQAEINSQLDLDKSDNSTAAVEAAEQDEDAA